MDRIQDSGSCDLGSNPGGITKAGILSEMIESLFLCLSRTFAIMGFGLIPVKAIPSKIKIF